MENSQHLSFEEIVKAAEKRAAQDMANAVPSYELPSDDAREIYPGSRISDAAQASGGRVVSHEVELSDASEEPVVPMPGYIKDQIEALKKRTNNSAEDSTTTEAMPDFTSSRRKASAYTPKYPPKSRY